MIPCHLTVIRTVNNPGIVQNALCFKSFDNTPDRIVDQCNLCIIIDNQLFLFFHSHYFRIASAKQRPHDIFGIRLFWQIHNPHGNIIHTVHIPILLRRIKGIVRTRKQHLQIERFIPLIIAHPFRSRTPGITVQMTFRRQRTGRIFPGSCLALFQARL